MIRYEEVSEHCMELINQSMNQYFPELSSVKIKYLFDTKKHVNKGHLVLGECRKPNELTKYFSLPETNDAEGYQYIISFDKIAFEVAEDVDRIRLIRHEQRHVMIIEEEEKKYKIYPHNIEDFVEEVALNTDDPDWARRIGKLARELYKTK